VSESSSGEGKLYAISINYLFDGMVVTEDIYNADASMLLSEAAQCWMPER
jgi:hypothetical protein